MFTWLLYFVRIKKMFALTVAVLVFTQLSAQHIGLVVRSKFPPVIKGNPVQVMYTSSNRLMPESGMMKSITYYDAAGMVVKTIQYNSDGSLNHQREIINDTINKRVLWDVLTIYRTGESTTDTNFYTYDNKGFLIRQVEKFGDSSRVTEYTNDEKGFPVQALVYDTKGKLWHKETAKYNHAQNVMTETVYSAEGKKIYSNEWKIDYSKPNGKKKGPKEKYNEQGDRIAYEYTDKNGRIINKVAEYHYDQRGNWTSMKWYVLVARFGKEVRQLDSEAYREYIYRD